MYKQYIGGKMIDGQGKPLAVYNPATNEVIDYVSAATAAQAVEALEICQETFKTWSKVPVAQRIQWMYKLRDAVLAEKEEIIDILSAESGRPYANACQDFNWFIENCTFYAEEAKRIQGTIYPNYNGKVSDCYLFADYRPMGVAVGHLAWNYPLGNMGLKICPAIVSGCCIVAKPSTQTPLASLKIGEIAEKIGFPAGVFNVVVGPSSEIGPALNSSKIPRLITLIGSSETGRQIMMEGSTSVKKYSLELGGNAPVIVMGDVDLDFVAKNIVLKKVGNAGQTCVCYNRIYIHESIYEAMIEKVAEYMKMVTIGKGRDAGEVVMGPMINRAARDRMFGIIDDAVANGARVVAGGKVPEGFEAGNYIEPTLLVDVNDSMRVSKEELFGPIIPLQPFSDLDEALKLAVDTEYGLSSYFYGHNTKEMAKAIEAFDSGEVFVNVGGGGPHVPHAGTKQSGIGCDKATASLLEYYDYKIVSICP